MKNNFTTEEIKKSVEYQWRKNQIKILLWEWLVISIVSLFVPFFATIHDLKLLGTGIFVWLCCIIFLGLFFGAFMLYYFKKNRYLLKNYGNFNCYEVILDKPSTSYAYRYSIYYTVNFSDDSIHKTIDTNPYFSNSIFSKFLPEDYNNKKVVGIYDDNKEKFYIIKKIS